MNQEQINREVKVAASIETSKEKIITIHTAITKVELKSELELKNLYDFIAQNFLPNKPIEESDEYRYFASAVYAVGYVGGGTFSSDFCLEFPDQLLLITGDFMVDGDDVTIYSFKLHSWQKSGFIVIEIPPDIEVDAISFTLAPEDAERLRALTRVWLEEFVHLEDQGEALMFGPTHQKKSYKKQSKELLTKNVEDWDEEMYETLCNVSSVWGLNLRFD